MDVHRRQQDRRRKGLRFAPYLEHGHFLVVADAPIDCMEDIRLPALAKGAGKVIRRLRLSERSPRQGCNQA